MAQVLLHRLIVDLALDNGFGVRANRSNGCNISTLSFSTPNNFAHFLTTTQDVTVLGPFASARKLVQKPWLKKIPTTIQQIVQRNFVDVIGFPRVRFPRDIKYLIQMLQHSKKNFFLASSPSSSSSSSSIG